MASCPTSPSLTPELIISDEKSPSETEDTRSCSKSTLPSTTSASTLCDTVETKKLTRFLSMQSSLECRRPPRPIGKRFSIDADPLSYILNVPTSDFSCNRLRKSSTPNVEEVLSILTSTTSHGKDSSPSRLSPTKKSDSFLEVPYEKGEIVDLIKLGNDPNVITYLTDDGHEVLLEHGSVSYDPIKSSKEISRATRNAFIFDRLLPGIYFAFITACSLLGGFGFALSRTKRRETTSKLIQQANATVLFNDGQRLAIKALRRASIYSLTGVFSFTCFLWLISGKPKAFSEFRTWAGSWLPSIKSKKPIEEEGRTEFENLTEFMQYLIDEDKKLKDRQK